MLVFKNIEEIKPYYNAETNTYEFKENDRMLDISIEFDLDIEESIHARNIVATTTTIKVGDMTAERDIIKGNTILSDITAANITARDIIDINYISAEKDINARNINVYDIYAENITTSNINALYIHVAKITAENINAENINAENINAENINGESK